MRSQVYKTPNSTTAAAVKAKASPSTSSTLTFTSTLIIRGYSPANSRSAGFHAPLVDSTPLHLLQNALSNPAIVHLYLQRVVLTAEILHALVALLQQRQWKVVSFYSCSIETPFSFYGISHVDDSSPRTMLPCLLISSLLSNVSELQILGGSKSILCLWLRQQLPAPAHSQSPCAIQNVHNDATKTTKHNSDIPPPSSSSSAAAAAAENVLPPIELQSLCIQLTPGNGGGVASGLLTVDECQRLGMWIRHCHKLKRLSLKGTRVEGPDRLAPAIAVATQLETLELVHLFHNNNNNNDNTTTTALTSQVQENFRLSQSLADLIVVRHGKQEFGYGAVGRLLQPPKQPQPPPQPHGNGNQKIQNEVLSNTMSFCHLKRLNLSNLYLTDDHAIALGQLLRTSSSSLSAPTGSTHHHHHHHHHQLEELNISFNNIGDKGMRAFAKYLPDMTTLKRVSLRPNPWSSKGSGPALVEGMCKNMSIEYLDSLVGVEQSPILRYYTYLNRGGRRLLYGTHYNCSDKYQQDNHLPLSNKESSSFLQTIPTKSSITQTQATLLLPNTSSNTIPASFWPIVLDRAQTISYPAGAPEAELIAKLNVLYFFLQNGILSQ